MARLSSSETGLACGQLHMMVRSGLGLADAFHVMAGDGGDERYDAISEQIREGAYPDDAMRSSGLFPTQACGLVGAGSDSGKLEEALGALAAYYNRLGRLEAQMKSAMGQPVAMLLMTSAVLAIVAMKVLPAFDGIYSSMGGHLDGAAGALLAAGRGARRAGPWIAAIAAVLAALCFVAYKIRPVRDKLAAKAGAVFGDRGVFRKLNDARYMQAVSMGLDSGLVPEEASRMAASMFDAGTTARARYDYCSEGLSKGGTLCEIGRTAGILDGQCAALLSTGIRSGCEADAARTVAGIMLEQSEDAMERLSGMVEPAMTAVSSILIGTAILSAMLPLLGAMGAMG